MDEGVTEGVRRETVTPCKCRHSNFSHDYFVGECQAMGPKKKICNCTHFRSAWSDNVKSR